MSHFKTHSGASKRLAVTASGKVKHKSANKRHLLRKKSTKQKRALNITGMVDPRDVKNIRLCLGIGTPRRD